MNTAIILNIDFSIAEATTESTTTDGSTTIGKSIKLHKNANNR
jgi:hypothetical protein